MRSIGRVGNGERRRAVVLLISLVVITIGALISTSVLYFAGAQSRAAQVGLRAGKSRSMAWSGVQAVMAELASQRDEMLQGASPSVTEYWSVIGENGETESLGPNQEQWGFRLLRVRRSGGVEDGGEWVACDPEMGKLDANSATKDMLTKLPGVSAALADAIISARNERRFASVTEMLRVPGMTSSLLFEGAEESGGSETQESVREGSTNDGAAIDADAKNPPSGGFNDEAEKPADAKFGMDTQDELAADSDGASGRGRPLVEFVTVFSFDPEVQLGFGAKASEARGNQRIDLNVEWSQELGTAIERRFDRALADGVKSLLESGRKFRKPSDIVKALREFQVKPDGWAEVLDAFTANGEEYRFGQVDLGTASEVVLACVPGISRNAAKEIVYRRGRLDDERRRTAAWPVLEGIVTEEEFEQAVDYLTTRCVQWRVVIEGGILPGLEEASFDGTDGSGGRWEESREESDSIEAAEFARRVDGRAVPETKERIVLEAVIDVSSEKARVAMLRDVTHLPLSRRLALKGRSERRRDAATVDAPSPGTNDSGGVRAGITPPETEPEDEPLLSFSDLELDAMESNSLPNIQPDSSSPSGARQGNNSRSGSAGVESRPKGDRRVGRWTTGGQGGKP